jgi:hypothetical protein
MGRAESKGINILSHTVPLKLSLSSFSPMGKITLLLRSFVLIMYASSLPLIYFVVKQLHAIPLTYAFPPISYARAVVLPEALQK